MALYAEYSQGLRFGYSFDDEVHLSGLATLGDANSTMAYIFGGASEPLGRPLALASFALQSGSWPTHPENFVRANTLIHLINVALVAWLAALLLRYTRIPLDRQAAAALGVAALWGSSPLLLSTSMMVVQRMASLSALFCLAGLILYLSGRQALGTRRSRGLILMSTGIAGGTLLATLAKENGALLPLLALVLEFVLVRPADPGGRTDQPPRWWTWLFLLLPTIVVIGVVFKLALQTGAHFPGRDFNMWERLLTETRVLLRYLRLILLPIQGDIGPLENMEISRSIWHPPSTLLAILAWPGLAVLAMQVRRPYRSLVGFGLAWFVCGHLLESGPIGLEIYFEHRNYLPAVGVCFALVAIVASVPLRESLRVAVVGLLLANSAFVLHQTARLWADPMLAGAVWHRNNPTSLRALQLYAYEIGQRGRSAEVRNLLDEAPLAMRASTAFQLYRLEVLCDIGTPQTIRAAAEEAIETLGAAPIDTASALQVARVAASQQRGACLGLEQAAVSSMFELIAAGSVRASSTAVAGAHYHLARIAMDQGNLDATMRHLEAGFALSPQLNSGVLMVQVLRSAELPDEACAAIDRVEARVPRRPFTRSQWLQATRTLRAELGAQCERGGAS